MPEDDPSRLFILDGLLSDRDSRLESSRKQCPPDIEEPEIDERLEADARKESVGERDGEGVRRIRRNERRTLILLLRCELSEGVNISASAGTVEVVDAEKERIRSGVYVGAFRIRKISFYNRY